MLTAAERRASYEIARQGGDGGRLQNMSGVTEAVGATRSWARQIAPPPSPPRASVTSPSPSPGKLRRLPKVAADEPVIVLLGMPNVGKSSIVSATSTKDPEINDYPFTTRALKLGHVVDPSSTRFQLMDTPGVLLRAEGERNAMEGLTLAAVRHLPSAVVFVMDLSGTCGEQSAPELQLAVRDQLRAQFGRRPWIDVRSKADLPLAPEVAEEDIPEGTLHVSVHEDVGIEELRQIMARLVGGDEELEGFVA